MVLKDLIGGFAPAKENLIEICISVQSSEQLGLITRVNMDKLNSFPTAQKTQLKAFLKGIIEDLK